MRPAAPRTGGARQITSRRRHRAAPTRGRRSPRPRNEAGANRSVTVWLVVLVFELENLVFYAQLLPLDIADRLDIRERSTGFSVEFFLEVSVPGAERFNTILQRHWRLHSAMDGTVECYA